MVAGLVFNGARLLTVARWGCAFALTFGGAAASDVGVEVVEETKLIASDGLAADQFGRAVALQNGFAVVGAPRHDAPGEANAGAAYVFVDDGSSWSESAILRASQPGAEDDFGTSVSIDGDTIIVGARRDDDSGFNAGTATVFVRNGAQWDVQAMLPPSTPQSNAQFGASVLVLGDLALVGAPLERAQGVVQGAVYVFQRVGTTWNEVQRLEGPASDQRFGFAMAADGDVLAVGAPGTTGGEGTVYYVRFGTEWVVEGSWLGASSFQAEPFGTRVAVQGVRVLAANSGRDAALLEFDGSALQVVESFSSQAFAHVESIAFVDGGVFVGAPSGGFGFIQTYTPTGDLWSPGSTVVPSDGTSGQEFSVSMSSSGERVLVGARFDDENGSDAGAAYVYRRRRVGPFGPWSVFETLAPERLQNDRFGSATAMDEERLLVGAPASGVAGPDGAGAVIAYTRRPGAWEEEQTLTALDATPNAAFGTVLDIDAERAVVGAPGDSEGGAGAGAAYVFERAGTSWVEDAKLTSSLAAANDTMGSAVALDGDSVAVGLPGAGAGEVLVFVREANGYTEQARLTALDAGPGDLAFGAAVALRGDTLVVGAPRDNNANGVDAGAIYVFERSGTTWAFGQKVVPDDVVSADVFGSAVSMSGDLAVVGTPRGFSGASGKAYVFDTMSTPWTQLARLDPSGGALSDGFGTSVAVVGERVLVGAPFDASQGPQAGAGYIFERDGDSWPQIFRLCVLIEENEFDQLGAAVAFDGALAVLGAPGADDRGSAFSLEETPSFDSFCSFVDGALTSCPCGLPGNQETGCELPQITGGVGLDVLAQADAPLNRATIRGSGYPLTTSPSVVLVRSSNLDPAGPSVFGDGVLCLRLPLVRLAATVADDGSAVHIVGHGSMAGPGTFFYQAWFRSIPATFCTPDAFNLSSGRQITW